MWQIEQNDKFQRDQKRYEKRHPKELAAITNNIKRYISQLNAAKNPKCVQAGYLHVGEGKGVIAIDQKGSKGSLQETRLYIYPDESKKILHFISIGNKKTQQKDILLARNYVDNLKEGHKP